MLKYKIIRFVLNASMNMPTRLTSLSSLVFLLFTHITVGQSLNPTFEMPLLVKQADIYHLEYLESGKVLLGGRIDFYGETEVNHLIRLNEDGSLDETFNYNSEIGVVRTFHVMASDEIVVGTGSHIYITSSEGHVTSSLALEQGHDLKLMVVADGYIWIGVLGSDFNFRITRLTLDLEADEEFNSPTFSSNVTGMASHQGKMLVSGFYLQLDGSSIDPIIRLNTDGTLDPDFNLSVSLPEGYESLEDILFRKLLVGSDNKILVQSNVFNGVLKLEADGTQDMDFSFDPINLRHVHIHDMYLDADSIYVVGTSNFYGDNDSFDNRMSKYDYDGNPDPDFQILSVTEKNKTPPILTVNANGEILLANINDIDNRYGLNRFSTNGILDASFVPPVGTFGSVDVAEIKGDKFVIAGDFNRLGFFASNDIAVLNLDGSVDETFQHIGNLEREPSDIGFHNGSIYLASKTEVRKFDANGELDGTFNSKPEFLFEGFRVEWFCSNIHIQEDGKIVTTSGNGIFRMLPNGDPDPGYGPFYPSISTTAFDSDMEADGQVVFGGHFDTIGDATFEDIVRINSDGTFDDSFQVERDASLMYGPTITAITSLTKDETMVFGFFNRFGGFATPKNMVKLDHTGKVDERFLKFLNLSFKVSAEGFKNYTSFRGGFVVAGYNDYYFKDNEVIFDYQLYSFNKSGIYQSQFILPQGYKASQEIIPLVINNNDMILISKFFVEGGDITNGIRIKINGLPKITNYEANLEITDAGLDITSDHLVVDDTDNVYPDDFAINVYSGDHFSVSGNTIIPEAGFSGIIEVPVTVNEGSNESNYVLIPMIVGTELATQTDPLLDVYPNPTTDFIEAASKKKLPVAIHDLSGTILMTGFTNKKMDLSALEDGVYILKMTEADGRVHSSKVIKQ